MSLLGSLKPGRDVRQVLDKDQSHRGGLPTSLVPRVRVRALSPARACARAHLSSSSAGTSTPDDAGAGLGFEVGGKGKPHGCMCVQFAKCNVISPYNSSGFRVSP